MPPAPAPSTGSPFFWLTSAGHFLSPGHFLPVPRGSGPVLAFSPPGTSAAGLTRGRWCAARDRGSAATSLQRGRRLRDRPSHAASGTCSLQAPNRCGHSGHTARLPLLRDLGAAVPGLVAESHCFVSLSGFLAV